MALQVPKLENPAPAPHIVVPVLRGKGRPRIYHGNTLPVSFRVPEQWRIDGSEKARQSEINLTQLFIIHYKNFLDRPAEETQAYIAAWEEEHGSLTEVHL